MKKIPNKQFVLGVSALLIVVLLTACRSAPPRPADNLRHLQGYWEGRGSGGACSVTISGNSLLYAQPATDDAQEEFWYETTLTLPAAAGPKQLHATIIKNNSPKQPHIGTVVVTIFKIEDGTLTLGVVKSFEEPPDESIVGDWDGVLDQFVLERAQPKENRAI